MSRSTLHVLRLVLSDGVERPYLLDEPVPSTRTTDDDPVYDPWVHLAYLLAQQGRDADWLARFTGLPSAAAREIAAAARRH
ncbi:hypothetical protein [Streptomyces sp. CBMA152]|uniref:hypothetical protein n=1 Tax=Streptomyces sp. CBMA152 TaxID=1896312 RepID=UPI0016603A3A|nr:hypothetical protein [Streptomyces sp. CBMA152]MBD0748076.1 hypothetical protein [Streptomyces sp. CBMA152]